MVINKKFAVKDAIDMLIKDASNAQDEGVFIDYLNTCSINLSSDSVYARKKGNNAISFGTSRTGTFTLEAEVIDINYLAWMLGGEIIKGTGESEGATLIKVTGKIPSRAYIIEGTFSCTAEDGTEIIQHIKMYNAKPQANADLSLSAIDVSNFSLTFDVLVDANDLMIELSDDETLLD